jgi:hypothetical protein
LRQLLAACKEAGLVAVDKILVKVHV